MKVKICGIIHPEDAEYAACLGADFIGIIFSDRSKRKVSLPLANEIAQAARQRGSRPIGVFIDETADQITSICEQTGIDVIQLHGLVSKQALPILQRLYSIVYAISVEKNGILSSMQSLPSSVQPLYDCLGGGEGIPFDWKAFSVPDRTDWILAGGLTPDNVAEAIRLLRPYGVDVSSGVESPHSKRKNPRLVKAFIQAAKIDKENI